MVSGSYEKARDMVQSHLKLVDVALELRDARAPLASENPMFADLLQGKKRLLLLNKADLADPCVNREWTEAFSKEGLKTLAFNARSDNTAELIALILREGAFVHEKQKTGKKTASDPPHGHRCSKCRKVFSDQSTRRKDDATH